MKYQGITIHKNKYCSTWYTRVRINGVQSYISAKTQKDCYNKLKKALKIVSAETITIQPKQETVRGITLQEWHDKWLKLYKLGKVKETTLRDYASLIRHIPTKTFKKELKLIEAEELNEIINNCKATRQKQKLYEFFKALFDKAVLNEHITKNIMNKLEKPKHEKNHGIALTNKQQEELLNNCKDIENIDILLIALYQGLRRGEVLGLTIDNIDYENNTLTINKAWNEYNKWDTTKNKQSIRTMPLFENSKRILIKYKNQKERIFNVTNTACTKMLEEVRKIMKMPKLHIKDMRSTFITRCKELNIPKHIIQSWVGHVIGSSVTDTVYTKHNKEIDSSFINIINNNDFKS